MNEKKVTIHKESKYKEEWYDYPFCIKEDGEVVLETIPLSIAEKVRDKLNGQQAILNELKEENKELREEWVFSFRTERAYHRVAEKELKEKIREQQATIFALKEENEQLKQKIQRWKTLYELKDAEVTARVDALNKVCEYYTSEVLFKSDVDPNKAVKEVITEILNTEVEM